MNGARKATLRRLRHQVAEAQARGRNLVLPDEQIEFYARRYEQLRTLDGRTPGGFQGFVESMEARHG